MTEMVPVFVPRESPNDETVTVVALPAPSGEPVQSGDLLAEVEGSKAVIEIDAPCEGVFVHLTQLGDDVAVSGLIGAIAPLGTTPEDALLMAKKLVGSSRRKTTKKSPAAQPTRPKDMPPVRADRPAFQPESARFSRPAIEEIQRLGLAQEDFAGHGMVTLEMVRARAEGRPVASTTNVAATPQTTAGRIAVIGAGSGAYQILSILLHAPQSEVIGIFDDAPEKAGETIRGIPVRGDIASLYDLLEGGQADAMILATSNHPAFRRGILAVAKARGFAMANAVHPTAVFDDNVRIGGGNFIGAFCYFGAETEIGSNCYLSSRTTFEHHNSIADGVTTGPNVATSGHVTIGDDVKFGAGIVVEPGLTIEPRARIASGQTITRNIAAEETVKTRKTIRGA